MLDWIHLPEVARDLEARQLAVHRIDDFRASVLPGCAKEFLSTDEKLALIEQAIQILSAHYCHLPHKRVSTGKDPIRALEALRMALALPSQGAEADEASGPGRAAEEELAFHRQLIAIFRGLKDRHFRYRLPDPFPGYIAFLPFLVKHYWSEGRPHVLVHRVSPGLEHARFAPPVRLTHWNGVPIWRQLERLGDRLEGGNEAAEQALGVARLTTRPLGWFPLPDEDWVTLRFLPVESGEGADAGRGEEITLPWAVATLPEADVAEARLSDGDSGAQPADCPLRAVDDETEKLNCVRRCLYLQQDEMKGQGGTRAFKPRTAYHYLPPDPEELVQGQVAEEDETDYSHPAFTGRRLRLADGRQLCYLRIRSFSFDRASAASLSDAEKRKRQLQYRNKYLSSFLSHVPRDLMSRDPIGLVLDVRGNTGGNIEMAYALLQYFLPSVPDSLRFHFLATRDNVWLAEQLERRLGAIDRPEDERERAAGEAPAGLRDSVVGALQTGAIYTPGLRQPVDGLARHIHGTHGQRYSGPVVLLTDALSYSATDMFVALFRDSGRGEIVCTDENIGAGGATVSTEGELLQLAQAALEGDGSVRPRVGYGLPPKNAGFLFSAQRVGRLVAPGEVAPIEEFGLAAGEMRRYRPQRGDVIGPSPAEDSPLTGYLAGLLDAAPPNRARIELRLELSREAGSALCGFAVKARGLARVEIALEGEPNRTVLDFDQEAADAQSDSATIDLARHFTRHPPAAEEAATALPARVVLTGYERGGGEPAESFQAITRKIFMPTGIGGFYQPVGEQRSFDLWPVDG